MSRCRACDEILSEFEMHLKQRDGRPEDLCKKCRDTIRGVVDDEDLHIGTIPYHYIEDTMRYLDDGDEIHVIWPEDFENLDE